MKRLIYLLSAATLILIPAFSQKSGNPFLGRWDITLDTPRGPVPDWLEVTDQGGQLKARYQPPTATNRPVQDVKLEGSHLIVTLNATTTWDLTAEGNKISGSQKRADMSTPLAGVRAPELKRPMPKAWNNPEPLFNGKDLTGWEPTVATAQNNWVAKDGEMLNQSHGANIKTTRKFDDFKLHIEYNIPDEGNSGIYLRGRYEVQVEYEPPTANDKLHAMGSVYGFLAPAVELPKKPGQWESYDITLVGRYVTVVRDGVKTIDNQEIPGITGGALDANEGEPGPIYVQGDHTGGMKLRNITVQTPKR
jgi:hypothetical protein